MVGVDWRRGGDNEGKLDGRDCGDSEVFARLRWPTVTLESKALSRDDVGTTPKFEGFERIAEEATEPCIVAAIANVAASGDISTFSGYGSSVKGSTEV